MKRTIYFTITAKDDVAREDFDRATREAEKLVSEIGDVFAEDEFEVDVERGPVIP